jgi:hypothetical protein
MQHMPYSTLPALPMLSVITPSYNQAAYIRHTIESVLVQDYPNGEHIVVDGGSTDGTVEILREYGERYPDRFRWVSEPDGGQSDALNKGLAMARGEIIGWQNSDDYYLPNSFGDALRYLLHHPEIAVVYGDCQLVDESGIPVGVLSSGSYDYGRLLYYCYIPNAASFMRRSALLGVGGVQQDLHYTMDYDLWLRLGFKNQMAYLPGLRGAWRQVAVAKTNTGLVRNRLECVDAVRQAVSSPLLPPALLEHGRIALQRHILEAMLVALAYGEHSIAENMLHEALTLDPNLSEWAYICRRLLAKRVVSQHWFGEVEAGRVGQVPREMLVLLRAVGQLHTRQARQIIALNHLFAALEGSQRSGYRHGLFHLLRALNTDRAWIRYPASLLALFRLSAGDGIADQLNLVVDRVRAVADRRRSRKQTTTLRAYATSAL